MMGNKLVIAAAGSGKTTYLVKRALASKSKRILITTYTQDNEAEIRKCFIALNGCVPSHVTIQTWFSFLIEQGARPYQGVVYKPEIRGMLLSTQRSGFRFPGASGPVYWGEKDLRHFYFSSDGRIYSDKLAKFVLRCENDSGGAVGDRLGRIYDEIMIDEIQDLAGYDLDIIIILLKLKSELLMVGDPRQVTYLTAHVNRFKKYSDGKIKDFIQAETPLGVSCEIDEGTLNVSHRNSKEICEFSSRLYPELAPVQACDCSGCRVPTEHSGIFLLRPSDVGDYLARFGAVQLTWDSQVEVEPHFERCNFGKSKGRTLEHVVIYPTKAMSDWLKDNNASLKSGARAKLYVAITRARYSVAFVVDDKVGEEIGDLSYWNPR